MQVSIIVSVISLAGSLLTATLAFYSGLLNPLFASATNYAFNNIKRRLNAIAVFKKHRTPLLHATLDLRSRLLSICDQSWISTINKDSPAFDKEFVVHHSCFLIGQYFAWCSIVRLESQFLDTPNAAPMYKALADAIIDVSRVFSRDDFRFGSGPFQLWKGEQSAIGEVVTITNKGGHLCSMGYAEFCDEWTTKPSFRGWFERIESDLKRLLTPEGRGQVQRLSDLTDALREMVLVLRPPTSGKAASHGLLSKGDLELAQEEVELERRSKISSASRR